MKKFLVIGNPIEHSLSPKLHNFWFKKNNINANYDKKKIDKSEIQEVILEIKNNKLNGINVTVPFKSDVIPFLDALSEESQITQSVNTIYMHNKKILGHNTDIKGFELSLRETRFNLKNKIIFLLGAGGVVPSMIYALEKLGVAKIVVSNRTKQKAENLTKLFPDIKILDWGKKPNKFDIIINTTSIGLKENDRIELDFSDCKDKLFYDLIYSGKTKFLKEREILNYTKDGMSMFVFQAQKSYETWLGYKPHVDDKLWDLLSN